MYIFTHALQRNKCEVNFGVMVPDRDVPLEVWSEFDVQVLDPTLVYDYWDRKGGRTAATNCKTWNIFNILEHKGHDASAQYKVQWVSHPENESTWEPLEQLWDYAQAFVYVYHI